MSVHTERSSTGCVEPLASRAAVLAATDDHPYVRTAVGATEVTGYRTARSVLWTGEAPWGSVAGALGDGAQAAAVFVELIAAGRIRSGQWLHLPRMDTVEVRPDLRPSGRYDWEFRWTLTPPPQVPGEERLVDLDERHHDQINRLLDDAHPTSATRPDDPRAQGWCGVFDAGRLVACGCDRSQGGVGFLASFAVAGSHRRRGLGAALTAGLTRRLLERYREVGLGVLPDNAPALRLYRRLGFTRCLTRSSVRTG